MTDSLIRGIMLGGEAGFVLSRTTNIGEKIRSLQNCAPVCTAAIGRIVSAAAIMSATLKNENDMLSISIYGNGPAGQLIAVAEYGPKIKAYITNPDVYLPARADGKLDVGAALGKDGYVTVIRRSGSAAPYVGKTGLVSGEIGEDLAAYYLESEQTPTALMLGALVDKDFSCIAAGGLLIQPMPDCSEGALMLLESAMRNIEPISHWINSDLTEVIKDKFESLDPEVLETCEPKWYCNCDENIPKAIVALGRHEAFDVIDQQGQLETKCHFCGKTVVFTREDINKLFDMAEAE